MNLYLFNTIINCVWYVFTILFVLYRFTTFFSYIYNFTKFCSKAWTCVYWGYERACNFIKSRGRPFDRLDNTEKEFLLPPQPKPTFVQRAKRYLSSMLYRDNQAPKQQELPIFQTQNDSFFTRYGNKSAGLGESYYLKARSKEHELFTNQINGLSESGGSSLLDTQYDNQNVNNTSQEVSLFFPESPNNNSNVPLSNSALFFESQYIHDHLQGRRNPQTTASVSLLTTQFNNNMTLPFANDPPACQRETTSSTSSSSTNTMSNAYTGNAHSTTAKHVFDININKNQLETTLSHSVNVRPNGFLHQYNELDDEITTNPYI